MEIKTRTNLSVPMKMIHYELQNVSENESYQSNFQIIQLDFHDTGAMLYQLSYEAIHWEQG